MYRHARSVLQEFSSKHALTNSQLPRSLSNERDCEEKSPQDGHALQQPSEATSRQIQIQKAKSVQDFTKEKVLLMFTLLCNKLVNPLLDTIMPGIKSEEQLYNLTDFRKGKWPRYLHSRGGSLRYSKCLEEPLPFKLKKALEIDDCIIKDPSLVFNGKINIKKTFGKIFPKNKRLVKYKAREDEFEGEPSAWYNVFLKQSADSNVESMTPNIHSGNLNRLCDFRAYDDAFNLDCTKVKGEPEQTTLELHTANTTARVEEILTEVPEKQGKTSDTSISDTYGNKGLVEENPNTHKSKEILSELKTDQKKGVDSKQSLNKGTETPKSSSLKLSTSSKPQTKIDQGVGKNSSKNVLDVPNKVSESLEGSSISTKQAGRNNGPGMKFITSSVKENAAEKFKVKENLSTLTEVNNKHTITHTKQSRNINSSKKLLRKAVLGPPNSSIKSNALKVRTTEESKKMDMVKKKSDIELQSGQQNVELKKTVKSRTETPLIKSEELTTNKNKLQSSTVLISPNTLTSKIVHEQKSCKKTEEMIELKKTERGEVDPKSSGTLINSTKLKDNAFEGKSFNKNRQLVEKTKSKSKNKLINTTNKPKYAVKRNFKFPLKAKAKDKKAKSIIPLGNSLKPKLVSFKTAEEPYFETKEKNLGGVSSDLINVKNVIESEFKALKSKQSRHTPAKQNEFKGVQPKNKSTEVDQKNFQQTKSQGSVKTENLKSNQNLSAVGLEPRNDQSSQNQQIDVSKHTQHQLKSQIHFVENHTKHAQLQTNLSNKKQHQVAKQMDTSNHGEYRQIKAEEKNHDQQHKAKIESYESIKAIRNQNSTAVNEVQKHHISKKNPQNNIPEKQAQRMYKDQVERKMGFGDNHFAKPQNKLSDNKLHQVPKELSISKQNQLSKATKHEGKINRKELPKAQVTEVNNQNHVEAHKQITKNNANQQDDVSIQKQNPTQKQAEATNHPLPEPKKQADVSVHKQNPTQKQDKATNHPLPEAKKQADVSFQKQNQTQKQAEATNYPLPEAKKQADVGIHKQNQTQKQAEATNHPLPEAKKQADVSFQKQNQTQKQAEATNHPLPEAKKQPDVSFQKQNQTQMQAEATNYPLLEAKKQADVSVHKQNPTQKQAEVTNHTISKDKKQAEVSNKNQQQAQSEAGISDKNFVLKNAQEIENSTFTGNSLTRKVSSVEDITRGLKQKIEKTEVSKSTQVDQGGVNVRPMKESDLSQTSNSLAKETKPKMLDSNFEIKQSVLSKISANINGQNKQLEVKKHDVQPVGNVEVLKPQFNSKKESISLINEKQKNTFFDINKKRNEKFNLLKTQEKLKSKIEVVDKKIDNEKLKPTLKRPASEHKKMRASRAKIAKNDDQLTKSDGPKDKNHNLMNRAVKESQNIWNSKSIDAMNSPSDARELRLSKSAEAVENPQVKVGVKSNDRKINNVDLLSVKINTDNGVQSKPKPTVHLDKQNNLQLGKNNESNGTTKQTTNMQGTTSTKAYVDDQVPNLKKPAENDTTLNASGFIKKEKHEVKKGEEMKTAIITDQNRKSFSRKSTEDEPVGKSDKNQAVKESHNIRNSKSADKIHSPSDARKLRLSKSVQAVENPQAKVGDKSDARRVNNVDSLSLKIETDNVTQSKPKPTAHLDKQNNLQLGKNNESNGTTMQTTNMQGTTSRKAYVDDQVPNLKKPAENDMKLNASGFIKMEKLEVKQGEKMKPPSLAELNNRKSFSHKSTEKERIGKSDKNQFETPKYDDVERAKNRTMTVLVPVENLKQKNKTEQPVQKPENKISLSTAKSASLESMSKISENPKIALAGQSKTVLEKTSRDSSHVKPVRNIQTVETQSVASNLNKKKIMSSKKSASLEFILERSKRQESEIKGLIKTTLEKTTPDVLNVKPVVNMQKAKPKSKASELNESSSIISKHRPTAKVSAPITPKIRDSSKQKLDKGKISNNEQSHNVSSNKSKTQEVRDMSIREAHNNLNPIEKLKKTHR